MTPHRRSPHGAAVIRLGLLVLATVLAAPADVRGATPSRPNILFIAIDDQNDWIGHLGGHPLARTPHLDRLAERGTSFLNAHCNAPLCNPARAALMTGLRPSTTGIYGLAPWFRSVPALRERVTLPQYFAAQGYRTSATGKIYHGGGRALQEEFQVIGPAGGVGSRPPAKLVGATPGDNNPLVDWGVWPLDNDDTTKGDYQVASWTIDQIKNAPTDQPWFIAAGFFLPHVPCYATQKWFDLYPDDDSVLPPVLEDDRGDTPRFSWYLHWDLPEPRLKWLRESGQWRNLVRSYLACTSFVDAQVGRILQALEQAGLAENTIVVVWGDNGFHLGEKAITGKNSLWDDGTRVPLIFAGPGVASGQRCLRPAELVDIFPTLIELAGLPGREDLDGLSLLQQLQNADAARTRPALTTHNRGNHTLRTEQWRYIRYADGSEELYELSRDPNEWVNLAGHAEFAGVVEDLRRWLPHSDAPPAPGSALRVLTYDRESGQAEWEGHIIAPGAPIP